MRSIQHQYSALASRSAESSSTKIVAAWATLVAIGYALLVSYLDPALP